MFLAGLSLSLSVETQYPGFSRKTGDGKQISRLATATAMSGSPLYLSHSVANNDHNTHVAAITRMLNH